jgi:putative transposase
LVKTTGVGGERGYDDGRKKVKGRKRHLLVDTQGLVLKAKVHPANVMDRDGIKPLLERARELFERLSHLWLDAGYNGKGKGKDWVEKVLGLTVEVVRHPEAPLCVGAGRARAGVGGLEGQRALTARGLQGPAEAMGRVERTFSWIDQNRRMSKDYERLPETSEAFIYVAMSRLMAKRLARS